MAFLCADIGTSSFKLALISESGELLARTRLRYSRNSSGLVPASAWEEAFYRALQGFSPELLSLDIRGIAISGNGPTLVPIKKDGSPLIPLYWNDPVDTAYMGIGGPSLYLPAVSQFFAKEGAAGVSFFLSSQEWLAYRLGAEPHSTLPTNLYAPWYWDSEQLEARGISAELFPTIVVPGTVVGILSAEAKKLAGLKGGDKIPIVSAGPDFFMAILGTACTEVGLVCDRAGSSEGINYCAASPLSPSSEEGFRSLPHWKEGLWNVSALLPQSGRLFEDFRRASGQSGRDYNEMLSDIDAAGSCTGPVCNPLAQAGRALVENLGLSVRAGIDGLEARGLPVSAMRLSGGQAQNDIWNQLKADIIDLPLVVGLVRDGELLGNAALILFALGEAEDPISAAKSLWREGRVFKPDPKRAAYYRERRIN